MNKGKLYLIPSPLGENDPLEVIPKPVLELASSLNTFVVEELRTTRRFLSKAGLKGKIDSLNFHILNEHSTESEVESLEALFNNGNNVGLISEAGLPAVADPGAKLVELAHKKGIEVVPAVGPSSLMLALMASGLNGQSFCFCGYLPSKPPQRKAKIKEIEKQSLIGRTSHSGNVENLGQTQIFIETPYRNDVLFSDLLEMCRPNTKICIAVNITLPDAYIRTLTTAQWKKEKLVIGKRPCVFLLQA